MTDTKSDQAVIATQAEDSPGAERLSCTMLAREHQKQKFQEFRKRVLEDGEAYAIMTAVSPHEILEAMDIPVVTNEWYSSIVAAKQLSSYYFDMMAQRGYHDGLARYVSLPFATTLDGDSERAPYGGLPKPLVLVSRTRGDYSQRIYEQWGNAFGVPYFPIEVPSSTVLGPCWWEAGLRDWESLYETHRLDFYVDQLKALIRFVENATGKRFNETVFEEQMHRINVLGETAQAVLDIVATTSPSPVPLPEQFPNIMACIWDRGSQWSVDHIQKYYAEVKERADQGIGFCPKEKIRLMWIGNGLWFNTAFYRAFEEKYGAVFVWSMYSNLAYTGYVKYFTDDPLRALAARHISMNEQLHLPPWMADWIIHEGKRLGAHGAINLIPKGDRLSANGTLFAKKAIERAGIPVLDIHASMVDARLWDNEKMTAIVEEFIEARIVLPTSK